MTPRALQILVAFTFAGLFASKTTTATSVVLTHAIQPEHEPDASIPCSDSSTTFESLNQTTSATPQNEEQSSASYSATDDVSWAIVSDQISDRLGGDKQALYDRFMQGCHKAARPETAHQECYETDRFRRVMNSLQPASMRNYTTHGFRKLRAPPEIFARLQAFWQANRDEADNEWDNPTPYQNSFDAPSSIVTLSDQSLPGGGPSLSAAISNAMRDILEEWTGQKLAGSSVYGIRVYHNQSILTPHVDRLPLVSSAIINVDQDVDQDWVLEVYGHDGKATNVTMKPGDMVLYESHSVIHGRPFPLQGKYFANVFVHFEPLGNVDSMEGLPEKGSLAPYVLPGSEWERNYYWSDHPQGWKLLNDILGLVDRGDLPTLKYVHQREQTILGQPTDWTNGWQAIHSAIVSGHLDVLKFLVEEVGIDVNAAFYEPVGRTCLDLAVDKQEEFGEVYLPMIEYLKSQGGLSFLEAHGAAMVESQ